MIEAFKNLELPLFELYFLDKEENVIKWKNISEDVGINTNFFFLPRIGEKIKITKEFVSTLFISSMSSLTEIKLSIEDFNIFFGKKDFYVFNIINISHKPYSDGDVNIEIILKLSEPEYR